MAQKLHQLALEIQGRLDSSFNGAMRTTQAQLKDLKDKVNNYKESQMKLRGSEVAYVRNANSVNELGQSLSKLNRVQADVARYKEARENTAELGRSYRQARIEAKAFTQAYEKDKSKTNKSAMQAAVKQSLKLEKSYQKQRTSLKTMQENLGKAGINTKKLSDEQKRLAGDIEKASKEQERFNNLNDKLAQKRVFWENLRSSAGKYAQTVWSAAKWTAGLTATLGYGAYKMVRSTAEAGDQADELSQRIRMNAEEVQKLQSVAKLSGVKDFGNAMLTMVKNTDLAVKKKGKAVDALDELRFKAKDLLTKGSVTALIAISQRLREIKDESARTRILQGLFGNQWDDMREMLMRGPEEIKKMMKEAEERGIISNAVSGQSGDFLDNIDEMQASIAGLKNSIAVELLPAVNDIVLAITEWIKENRALISVEVREWIKKAKEYLPNIIAAFKSFADGVVAVKNALSAAVDMVGGFEKAMYGLAVYLGGKTFLGPVLGAGKALAGVMGAGTAASGAGGLAAGVLGPLAVGAAGAAVLGYSMNKMSDAMIENMMAKDRLAKNEDFQGYLKAFTKAKDAGNIEGMKSTWSGMQLNPNDMVRFEKTNASDISWMRQQMERYGIGGQPINVNVKGSEGQQSNVTASAAAPEINLENTPEVNVEAQTNLKVNTQNRIEAAMRARGGLVSSPTLSTLAERGAEMVVPLSSADKGLGISRLTEAARKLGFNVSPDSEATRKINLNVSLGSEPPLDKFKQRDNSEVNNIPRITFAPTYNITGSDPEKTAEMVDTVTRRSFSEMMEEYFAGKERLSFVTT